MRALYFDGRSAQGREVELLQQGGELLARGDGDATQAVVARWPLARVRWPERTRHGQRLVRLPDGGELHVADGAAFDAWRTAHGHREGWVVRVQQHWRATLAAAAGLVVLLVAGYLWGVPVAARAVVALLPAAVDAAVGRAALESIEERWLRPSRLPPARQAELQRQLAAALQALGATDRHAAPVAWTLQLRAGGEMLGANAFALPGGTIVVTDELVELLEGQPATLLSVLGHEWGHLRHRHGMRAVAQASLLALATSLMLGDVSSVIAGIPAMVGQLGYSRDAEREADAEAVRVLRAAGLSPAAMVALFARLQARRNAKASGSSSLPLALASHPLDDERIAYFRAAAAAR